jgi:hypothetical protein
LTELSAWVSKQDDNQGDECGKVARAYRPVRQNSPTTGTSLVLRRQITKANRKQLGKKQPTPQKSYFEQLESINSKKKFYGGDSRK